MSESIMPRKDPKQEFKAVCIDCGKEYIIPLDEEKFMFQKGLVMPKRCRDCRAKKRARYNAEQDAK